MLMGRDVQARDRLPEQREYSSVRGVRWLAGHL